MAGVSLTFCISLQRVERVLCLCSPQGPMVLVSDLDFNRQVWAQELPLVWRWQVDWPSWGFPVLTWLLPVTDAKTHSGSQSPCLRLWRKRSLRSAHGLSCWFTSLVSSVHTSFLISMTPAALTPGASEGFGIRTAQRHTVLVRCDHFHLLQVHTLRSITRVLGSPGP